MTVDGAVSPTPGCCPQVGGLSRYRCDFSHLTPASALFWRVVCQHYHRPGTQPPPPRFPVHVLAPSRGWRPVPTSLPASISRPGRLRGAAGRRAGPLPDGVLPGPGCCLTQKTPHPGGGGLVRVRVEFSVRSAQNSLEMPLDSRLLGVSPGVRPGPLPPRGLAERPGQVVRSLFFRALRCAASPARPTLHPLDQDLFPSHRGKPLPSPLSNSVTV